MNCQNLTSIKLFNNQIKVTFKLKFYEKKKNVFFTYSDIDWNRKL